MNKIIKNAVLLGIIFILLLTFTSCAKNQTGEKEETTQVENVTSESKKEAKYTEKPSKETSTEKISKKNDIPISSTFYSKDTLMTIKKNAEENFEFKAMKQIAIAGAERYMKLSYDELWNMVFGPELKRSWMVKSDGICPSCKKPVIMYDWIIEPKGHPWKLKCPKCEELFPKNDFYAYYKSGLDKSGRFSKELADNSLLYNVESGDKNDKFGVDDGTGYVDADGQIYRFIQTYLIYGQWKKTVLDAIKKLSDAYVYTQNAEYGVRALIIIDRLADFFPEFDYMTQGWMYERLNSNQGYISYNIDSAFEIKDLALAYDKVIEVLYTEAKLTEFLSSKAKKTGIKNKKRTPDDIKRNIDTRILKDVIAHPEKYRSNPPYTELALFVSKAVLNWPDNQEELEDEIAKIIKKNTKYDGMTGESGMAGYATMGKSAIAKLCNIFMQADPQFIQKMYKRVPKLYDAYRFHIDLYCVGSYYPNLGDTGYFGVPTGGYPNSGGDENLILYELYELTGDKDLVKVLYRSNGFNTTGAFKKFVAIEGLKEKYETVKDIVEEGSKIKLKSVRKDEYQMAVLRSGKSPDERALWINFGTNKTSHYHGDGMNIGIYLQDANVMPDNGYPNVSYGDGWRSDVVRWTRGTISHNVVSFNKQAQRRTDGKIDLWSIGDMFKVLRANAPGMFEGVKKYERTIAMVDEGKNSYYVDVFRVGDGPAGSYEKYNRSNIGDMKTTGLKLIDTKREYPGHVFMNNFKKNTGNLEKWSADWVIRDRLNVISYAYGVHFKMTDLTKNEKVFTADTWLPPSMSMKSKGHEGFYLPTVISEKTVKKDEVATFLSVLQPYSREPFISQIDRLNCVSKDNNIYDSNAAVKVQLDNGYTDIVILLDPDLKQDKKDVSVKNDKGVIKTNAQACILRYNKSGKLMLIRASKGDYVKIKEKKYDVSNTDDFTIYDFKD